jgi:hypothetical protein
MFLFYYFLTHAFDYTATDHSTLFKSARFVSREKENEKNANIEHRSSHTNMIRYLLITTDQVKPYNKKKESDEYTWLSLEEDIQYLTSFLKHENKAARLFLNK